MILACFLVMRLVLRKEVMAKVKTAKQNWTLQPEVLVRKPQVATHRIVQQTSVWDQTAVSAGLAFETYLYLILNQCFDACSWVIVAVGSDIKHQQDDVPWFHIRH